MKEPKQVHYKHNRLQQLRGFCHVVQTGSISKAAERMFLSQPSVSLQIQALERELQVILFERNGPSLKLTPEGQALYELGQPLVDGMDNLYESFLDRFSDVNTGALSIAAGPSVIDYIIKEPVRQFSTEFANVKLKLSTMTGEEAIAAVSNDSVDLAIAPLPEAVDNIRYEKLFSFNTVLIMPKGHSLSEVTEPSLEEIASHGFVMSEDYAMVGHVFKQHHLSMDITAEVGGLHLVKRLVEQGMGISIVSAACLEKEDSLVVKDLSRFFPAAAYGLLLRKGRFLSPQVKSFIELVKRQEASPYSYQQLMQGLTVGMPLEAVAG